MVHHMKPSHSSPLTPVDPWAYIIAESERISSICHLVGTGLKLLVAGHLVSSRASDRVNMVFSPFCMSMRYKKLQNGAPLPEASYVPTNTQSLGTHSDQLCSHVRLTQHCVPRPLNECECGFQEMCGKLIPGCAPASDTSTLDCSCWTKCP